jgi:hypothetical protein
MSTLCSSSSARNPLKTRRKNSPQVCRSFPTFGAQWSHDLRTDDRRADRRSSYRLSTAPVFPLPRSLFTSSLLHLFTSSPAPSIPRLSNH